MAPMLPGRRSAVVVPGERLVPGQCGYGGAGGYSAGSSGSWVRRADTGALVDLARAEAAVRGILDSPLLKAISDALPDGATFGFNSADGRTWIHVFGPGGSLGREVSREVLNTALVSLGRAPLDS
jgi:hypothetical protein